MSVSVLFPHIAYPWRLGSIPLAFVEFPPHRLPSSAAPCCRLPFRLIPCVLPLCPVVLPAIPPPPSPALPAPSRLVPHTTFTPQCLAHRSSSQLPLRILPSVLPLCHVIPSCRPPSAHPPAPPSTQLSSHNAWRTLSSPVTSSWATHSLSQRWCPPTPLFQTTSYHRTQGWLPAHGQVLQLARCLLPPPVSYSAWLLAAGAPATAPPALPRQPLFEPSF
ncbi:hypothetical protein BJ912DRAFT_1062832 [Pholiota molesta]|nr:hypothetical protein BJ912DRAFT_1062832 [Pholiota molesta]